MPRTTAITARLKPGWRYDGKRRRFVSTLHEPGGREFRDELPRYTRIRPLIPELSSVSPEGLSEDERRLARTIHLFLPRGSDASDVLKHVEEWDFVDEAWLTPSPSPASGH